MSNENHLAVAKASRGSSSHLNKAARQVVPAFLQKIYEMVNDPANESLIRWSDGGDSFIVLDHERFAREVLGRWFKHQNFSSFVRQLNMYGFRKVPHLQQGVLKSDNDSEYWHFEHPSFRRGQPDLLCLIQRKKPQENRPANDEQGAELVNSSGGATVAPNDDIRTIADGISAIRKHQAAISADMNELKLSNQQLWHETIQNKEKLAKQEQTMLLLQQYIAAMWSMVLPNLKRGQGAVNSPGVRKPPQRLMISDGRENKNQKMTTEDQEVLNSPHERFMKEPSPTPSAHISAVDAPTPGIAPPDSILFSNESATIPPTPSSEVPIPMQHEQPLPSFALPNSTALMAQNQQWPPPEINIDDALSFVSPDQRKQLQAMVHQMWQQQQLQNPDQMNQLPYYLPDISSGQVATPQMLSQQLAAFNPNIPFPPPDPSQLPHFDPSLIPFQVDPSMKALENNTQRLQGASTQVDELGVATDRLEGDVNQWFQTHGLGDQLGSTSNFAGPSVSGQSELGTDDLTAATAATHGFDINSLWNDYPLEEYAGGDAAAGTAPADHGVDAIVETVATPSVQSVGSPMSTTSEGGTKSKKRKAEAPGEEGAASQPSGRSKRKK